MPSQTFREYVLASLSVAYQKLKLPENIFKSVVKTMQAISTREWVYFTGVEVSTLPAGLTVDGMGDLVLDPGATAEVVLLMPKLSLSQQAYVRRLLLDGMGVEVSIIKAYPAEGGNPAASRTFAAGNLPLLTDNFQVKLTFQPGGIFRGLGVLYEIDA